MLASLCNLMAEAAAILSYSRPLPRAKNDFHKGNCNPRGSVSSGHTLGRRSSGREIVTSKSVYLRPDPHSRRADRAAHTSWYSCSDLRTTAYRVTRGNSDKCCRFTDEDAGDSKSSYEHADRFFNTDRNSRRNDHTDPPTDADSDANSPTHIHANRNLDLATDSDAFTRPTYRFFRPGRSTA